MEWDNPPETFLHKPSKISQMHMQKLELLSLLSTWACLVVWVFCFVLLGFFYTILKLTQATLKIVSQKLQIFLYADVWYFSPLNLKVHFRKILRQYRASYLVFHSETGTRIELCLPSSKSITVPTTVCGLHPLSQLIRSHKTSSNTNTVSHI